MLLFYLPLRNLLETNTNLKTIYFYFILEFKMPYFVLNRKVEEEKLRLQKVYLMGLHTKKKKE